TALRLAGGNRPGPERVKPAAGPHRPRTTRRETSSKELTAESGNGETARLPALDPGRSGSENTDAGLVMDLLLSGTARWPIWSAHACVPVWRRQWTPATRGS